jgi:hypothetical protein
METVTPTILKAPERLENRKSMANGSGVSAVVGGMIEVSR